MTRLDAREDGVCSLSTGHISSANTWVRYL